jgi:predicted hotdog family 3-hydroxylacyl-ACP dehydratase
MIPEKTLPSVEDLLPHRGSMLLLDRVTEFTDDVAIAEYRPREDAWYADDLGRMPGWLGVELMAQTVAVHVSMLKRRAGLPPRPGVLLGTRRHHGVAAFAAGSVLSICAREIFRDARGLAGYECAITQGADTLAEATLKLFEPEDFERFMQEQEHPG